MRLIRGERHVEKGARGVELISCQLKICVDRQEWQEDIFERLEMSFTTMTKSTAAGRKKAQLQSEESKPVTEGRGVWTPEEHQLFVDSITLFPSGPWKEIASHVGTRTARQTMTHAQKYRQKIVRRLRNACLSDKYSSLFLMDQSSRFNMLLSNDEQFNDSILATSLAIAAEQELSRLGIMSDGGASSMEIGVGSSSAWSSVFVEPTDLNDSNMYQKHLPLAINFSSTGGSPYYLDGPCSEPNDIEFDKCMDFLIETFHQET